MSKFKVPAVNDELMTGLPIPLPIPARTLPHSEKGKQELRRASYIISLKSVLYIALGVIALFVFLSFL